MERYLSLQTRRTLNFCVTLRPLNERTKAIMEELLHYVWHHRLLPLGPLHTVEGQDVEVIDPGLHNRNAGPDFFNAKVRIGGTLWVGNVEIHLRASDWVRHGHQEDAAYNSVILHVVEVADTDVTTADGKLLPQLVVPIPEQVRRHYAELCTTEDYPRCWRIIPRLSGLMIHSWMSALLCERLQQRADRCMGWLRAVDGDWERTLFIALARNFGFGLNGDAFETWARHLPLHAAAKHRDDPFQLQALFLGTAGLLTLEAVPPTAREATSSCASRRSGPTCATSSSCQNPCTTPSGATCGCGHRTSHTCALSSWHTSTDAAQPASRL